MYRHGRFELSFECGHVGWHLLVGFSAHDEGDEKLADAVTFESMVKVIRAWFSVIGSTATSTAARIGPSMPRTPQVWRKRRLRQLGG